MGWVQRSWLSGIIRGRRYRQDVTDLGRKYQRRAWAREAGRDWLSILCWTASAAAFVLAISAFTRPTPAWWTAAALLVLALLAGCGAVRRDRRIWRDVLDAPSAQEATDAPSNVKRVK